MKTRELIGLNTKWYRYQKGMTQETLAEKTSFKMAYLSTIETGNANLTSDNIDVLADIFGIPQKSLLEESTAKKALKLPPRVDMYKKEMGKS